MYVITQRPIRLAGAVVINKGVFGKVISRELVLRSDKVTVQSETITVHFSGGKQCAFDVFSLSYFCIIFEHTPPSSAWYKLKSICMH